MELVEQSLRQALSHYESQLKAEATRRNELEEKLRSILSESSDSQSKVHNRESSLLKLLEQKDLELSEARIEISKLYSSNRTLIGEKEILQDKLQKAQDNFSYVESQNLYDEINMLKKNLEETQSMRSKFEAALTQAQSNPGLNSDLEAVEKRFLEKKSELKLTKELLEQKETESNELKDQLAELKNDLELSNEIADQKETENQELEEQIAELKNELNQVYEKNAILNENIEELEHQKSSLKTQMESLQDKLCQEQTKVAQLYEKQTSASEKETSESQTVNQSLNISVDCLNYSGIDTIIYNTLKANRFSGTFSKLTEGYYLIDHQRVYISLLNSKPVVQLGSSLVPLEDFLQEPEAPVLRSSQNTNFKQESPQTRRKHASMQHDRKDSLSSENKESKLNLSPSKRFLCSTISSQNKKSPNKKESHKRKSRYLNF